MLKKILIATVFVAVIGVLVFGAINRTMAKSESESSNSGQGNYGRGSSQVLSSEQADEVYVQGQGNVGKGREAGTGAYEAGTLENLPVVTPGELSAEESAALLYMREEEKLAHDVYVTLYDQWGLPTFQNISQSEQAHTDAVKALLDRYGLSDPASSVVGVFTNPDLQALYTELVKRGSQSLAEALKVGAAIEEIDILDLQERLVQTDNADIAQVFNNLMRASYNHLRGFVSALQAQTGETYQPQYMSAEAYQQSLGSAAGGYGNSNSRGNGQGGNGAGGGRGGGRP
jgi:hypothetical protein